MRKVLIIYVLGLLFSIKGTYLLAQPNADAVVAKMAQALADSLPDSMHYISWIHINRKYSQGPALILSDRSMRYVKVSRSWVERQIITRWQYFATDSIPTSQYELVYCDTVPRDQLHALKPQYCKDFPLERNGILPAYIIPGLLTLSIITLTTALFYGRSGG
jgi:hypothetical protein